MAKGPRIRCQALLKNGDQCKHNALKNQRYCGTRSHQEQGAVATGIPPVNALIAPTRAHAQVGDEDREFSPHFAEIIKLCKDTIKAPTERSGMLAQWARIQLDAVRHAMEHQRLMDGLGIGTTHVINVHPPTDKPRPPVEDDGPVGASEGDTGDNGERVLN